MFKFLTKKKSNFSAQCALCKQPLDKDSAYVLTTAEVISSRKFWDSIMTEPDTMSYTEAYFSKGDATAENIRGMIFKKYSGEDKVWVISDSQLHLFDIDESRAKEQASLWWESGGTFVPDRAKNSLTELGERSFDEIKTYAVTEAGRARVEALS